MAFSVVRDDATVRTRTRRSQEAATSPQIDTHAVEMTTTATMMIVTGEMIATATTTGTAMTTRTAMIEDGTRTALNGLGGRVP